MSTLAPANSGAGSPPLGLHSVTFSLKGNSSLFVSPLTGISQQATRSGDKWMCDLEFAPMVEADFRAWMAVLSKVASRGDLLALGDWGSPRPQSYSSGTGWGTPLVNGASQAGRSLVTDGWTNGTTLKAGDYISFDNTFYRELHVLEADVTANGSGQATLTLSPAIRRAPADNNPILLDAYLFGGSSRCYGEFALSPGQAVSWQSVTGNLRQIQPLSFSEYLR